MFNFNKKKNEEEIWTETNDILVVFDNDKKTSQIERVTYIKDGAIYVTGRHVVPIDDVEITNGDDGRVFFYRAPTQSVTETQRLARLERSMVLNQITAYKQPDNNSVDITKLLLFGLVALAFVTIGISGCTTGGGL